VRKRPAKGERNLLSKRRGEDAMGKEEVLIFIFIDPCPHKPPTRPQPSNPSIDLCSCRRRQTTKKKMKKRVVVGKDRGEDE
jgi:hypothetical protein